MPSNGGAGAMSFSDRFFSYETFKVLRVRDRRLGGLYRLFQATILLYIASSIIYQQRYLKTENVINGAVRVTLRAPVDGVATPGYCKSPTSSGQPQSPSLPGSTPPCLYWSSNDILYEPGVDGALVTTRAQITQYGPFDNKSANNNNQQHQCDVNVPIVAGCDPHTAPTALLLPTSLVADIERFTLMLEHSIRGQATGLQIRSGNMESGLLRDSESGQVLKTFTDQSRYVPATTMTITKINGSDATTTATTATASVGSSKMVHLAGDVMTVGEFLRAAGVNLDDISSSPSASVNETVRSSGVVVIVVIQYAAKGWNPNKISYEYLPKAIPDQEYKVIETIRDFRGGNRVEINRHGIRIVFSQAGQLGQFSLMTLLTNLVAAVALFKVANIIVELMMLRLHPQKKIYIRAKFEHTKDGAPVLKRDGASNSSIAGLEELTAGEEESQTRNSNTSSGSRGRLQDVEEGALPNSLAAFGSGKGTRRTDGFDVPMDGFTRRGGVDEEAASRDHHGELGDYSTDSDDSDDSDTDAKGDRRMSSHGQDSMTMAQSSSVDPTRSQLRVVVSRQSNNNLSGYTSKDSCRGATTPISTNGTVGRQQGGQLTKAVATTMATTATAMSGVDWNRNGSSSALNGGDITPGVARATIRPSGASMYGHGYGSVTPRESTDEIEIETRFGPMRLNKCKGFNLGGLSLTGTSPLTPSPSQTRYAFGSVCRGSAIPERSTIYGVSTPSPTRGGGSGEAFSAFRSPATMQAASPSPVFFSHSHHHHHYGSNMGRRESVAEDSNLDKRSKEQPSSIKKSSPSSPHKMTRTLKSRHSTSSLSSLSSSSSSSSLATATATGTSTSSRKQPQRNGSLRHTLRSSVSSPSLLTSHRDARSAVAVSSGLPVRPQLASHSDLPPKSGCVDPSLASLSTSSSPCGSTTATRKSGAGEEEEEGDSGLIGTRLLTGGSIGHLSQLTQQQQQQMEATSDSSGNSNGAHASATMSVNSAFVRSLSEPQGSASALVNTVSHFTGHSSFTTTDSSYPTNTITSSSVSAARVSAEYPFTRHPSSSSGTNPSTQAAPLPLHPILSTSVHLQSQHSLVASSTTTTPVTPTPYTTTAVSCGISPLSSILSPTHPSTPTMTTPLTTTTTTSNMMPTTTTTTTTTTTSASTSTTTPQYYTHPTSTFFTSPITSSCTTTMPDSGIQVLGPTITMIMKDNRRLVLRRSAPLILNEGVGEERAARM